ncbi:MAG: hypothetical protein IT440_08300 [Phycisphaeraceae bacterium]|nr:hypothetical protein [Phycisphaeraceae bacterium]
MTDANRTPEAELLDYLQQRDVKCPTCGYNLRDLRRARCPECGSGLGLTVSVVDPFLSAWVVMVGVLFSAAGVGMFMLAYLTSMGFPPLPRSWIGKFAQGAIFYLIAAIPVALVTALCRRPFLRLNHLRQIRAALLVTLVTLGCAGILGYTLFILR